MTSSKIGTECRSIWVFYLGYRMAVGERGGAKGRTSAEKQKEEKDGGQEDKRQTWKRWGGKCTLRAPLPPSSQPPPSPFFQLLLSEVRVNKRDVTQPFHSLVPTGKRPRAPSLSDDYRVTCRANLRSWTCVKWSKWGTFFLTFPLVSITPMFFFLLCFKCCWTMFLKQNKKKVHKKSIFSLLFTIICKK